MLQDWQDLGGTTYTVTVTDSNTPVACTVSQTVVIFEPDPITASTSITPSNCGGSNGSVTVFNAAGGDGGPYSYVWDLSASGGGTVTAGPSASDTQTSLGAGAYPVTISDGSGCTTISTANIIDNGAPTIATTNNTSVTCFGASTGAAGVSVTGGVLTTGYTFEFIDPSGASFATGTSNDGLNIDASSLWAGTWTVNVSDNAAPPCVVTQTITIIEAPLLTISILPTPTDPSCFGFSDGTATASANGGSPTYAFAWSSSENVDAAVALPEGVSSVTVTDIFGCTAATTVALAQPPVLTVTVSATDAFATGVPMERWMLLYRGELLVQGILTYGRMALLLRI